MPYQVNPWLLAPGVLWLGLIAIGPIWFPRLWRQHLGKAALVIAAVTLGAWLMLHQSLQPIVQTAQQYVSFIALIGSLYVVAGGIHLTVPQNIGRGRSVAFLFLCGLAANVVGTTGATVLFIRPWLKLHRSRPSVCHVVFFIFIVGNIGGGLMPTGDPPLLLGFLNGVPFWWVLRHCGLPWLLSMVLLLIIYYALDRSKPILPTETTTDSWNCSGRLNFFLLAIIIAAVFVPRPFFLREAIMLAAAATSYFLTKKEVYYANQFRFEPILEVAILFFGIFATLTPMMNWLHLHAHTLLGRHLSPAGVYWSSGGISTVFDNAPAYLAFANALTIAFTGPMGGTAPGLTPLVSQGSTYLAALSVATVFFGAVTYIGNGPNLLIKAIAEEQRVRTPSFAGYIFRWSLPILAPVLVIVWLLFFR